METALMEKPKTSQRQKTYKAEEVFTSFTKKVMESFAKKLTHSPYFTSHEKDDLVQELGLALWQSMDNFDPGVSHFNCYATAVISRSAKTMLRQRRRLKRSCQRDSQVASCTEQSSTSEPVHPSSLTEQDAARRLQRSPRDPCEAMELCEDIDAVLESLTPRLRHTARALMQHSTSSAAVHLRISRATLHRRIELLREHFAAMSFNEYL